MNTQNKLINDIMSTYDNILENKNVLEAADVYNNVDFKDGVVGNSKPSRDNINISLLQDIETAAKAAGVKVDITTAVSGHDKGTRHETGNAVDIAVINGKAVSLSNRSDVDKLVGHLEKMGYVKNKGESTSIPKSILTFGYKGHNNHVHISNTSSSPSKSNGEFETDTEDESIVSSIDKSIKKAFGLNEGKKLEENIKRIKGLL
jgi:hypothetical protein